MNDAAQPIKPEAWFLAPTLGSNSEVWMHRQAVGMNRFSVHAFVDEYQNQGAYPCSSILVTLRPQQPNFSSKFATQAYLAIQAIRNRRDCWFRGSPNEVAWWKEQLSVSKPAVALCQYGTTATRLAPLLIKCGVPTVVHFHGFDLSSALSRPVYHYKLKQLIPQVTGCVVVAEYMKEWLLSQGLPEKRLRKIPCGVPVGDFPQAKHVGEQPCRFVAVGRLTEKKRPDLTVRAFAEAKKQGSAATLTLIGEGPLDEECRRLAEKLGVVESVEFLGPQPVGVVQQRLQNAGAFVQHSATAKSGDKEGWPVAIAEAACSGLPVISTRHASIPEQVEHGVTGLLCAEGDWRGMSDNMRRLADSPELRVQMGIAAREKLSAFDSVGQIGQLEDFLLECASVGRP